MTAAVMVCAPLAQEGLSFWNDLIVECDRYTGLINAAILTEGLGPVDLLECDHSPDLNIRKSAPPATGIRLSIDFFSWGPVIRGKVTEREKASECCLEEWEVPIAKDLDGTVIAIFNEGRSFSPDDLARYIMQRFRRYYPDVSLP